MALLASVVACGNGLAEPIVADLGEGGAAPLEGAGGAPTGTADAGSTGGTAPLVDNEYCASVELWPEADANFEEVIQTMIDGARALGVGCNGNGLAEPLPPLAREPALKCAARVHARDMVERSFFSHTNPDGEGPRERMLRAGASVVSFGEVIGNSNAGASTIRDTIWAGGPDCEALMSAEFDAMGVGYYEEVWSVDLGRLP